MSSNGFESWALKCADVNANPHSEILSRVRVQIMTLFKSRRVHAKLGLCVSAVSAAFVYTFALPVMGQTPARPNRQISITVKNSDEYRTCSQSLLSVGLRALRPSTKVDDDGFFEWKQSFVRSRGSLPVAHLIASGRTNAHSPNVESIDLKLATKVPAPKTLPISAMTPDHNLAEHIRNKLWALEASMKAAQQFVRNSLKDESKVFFRISPTQLSHTTHPELQIGVIRSEVSAPLIPNLSGETKFHGHETPLTFVALQSIPEVPAPEFMDERLRAAIEYENSRRSPDLKPPFKRELPVLKIRWDGKNISLHSGLARIMDLEDTRSGFSGSQTLAVLLMDLNVAKAVFKKSFGSRFSQDPPR